MLVVDLVCAHGHGFEGWFQSAADLDGQRERGLLSCPACGDQSVQRRPSATRFNRMGVGDARLAEMAQRAAVSAPGVVGHTPASGQSGAHRQQANRAATSPGEASHAASAEMPEKHAPAHPLKDGDRARDMAQAVEAVQAAYLSMVRQVMACTEDVGDQFVEKARRMHYGDEEARAIRGQATPQDRQALQDEGIEVLSLPVPEGLKGPLQ